MSAQSSESEGPQFSFSQEDLLTCILPSLTEIGTVVFIFTLDDNLTEVQALVEQVKEKTAHIQALAHSTVGQTLPTPLRKLFPPSSASRGHCFSSNTKGTSSRPLCVCALFRSSSMS
ncbi:glucokinase regulatory protein-like isoform X2 [Mustela lutreola]|uniref:glucokinase regulatory protein-like isoform X2 n=1 Tax=Mustela lutreola TaxID=9666 RepID=UPI002796EF5B|nr:glucokinase regulatory protein-like isoform X2 [Mustela lutreola]